MIKAVCTCGAEFNQLAFGDIEFHFFQRFLDRHRDCYKMYSECCGEVMRDDYPYIGRCPRCKENCCGERG